MKKKTLALVLAFTMTAALFTGCGSKKETETTQPQTETAAETESEEVDDQTAADEVAALIDAIYVQTRNENTDEQCAAAKAAWDKLTDAQKELVEGENADPDYFGRDTGDASKDDPLNEDGIGENELLVVSFGTSFNDSRAEDIGGVEKALQEANPDWSVRRAFTAQIIINHVQARDGEKIDNVELVEGENADPDYFGRDTGDASKDDPLNEDGIGENELLVVSFGTSFNDSRAEDIGGVEKALQEANPDWSVRRAFTAQIIINHVQARDGEKIDWLKGKQV